MVSMGGPACPEQSARSCASQCEHELLVQMATQPMNGGAPFDAGQYSFFDSTGDDGGLEGGLDDGLEGGLEV